MDFGAKHNILRILAGLGCEVTVVPAATSAEEILGAQPRWGLPLQRPG